MVDHHPLADCKPGHALAGGDDGSGHLMAEDARRGVRTKVNLLQVRPADAAGGNLNQQLSWANHRHGHRLQAQIVDAVVNDGPHGGRNIRIDPGFSVLGSH